MVVNENSLCNRSRLQMYGCTVLGLTETEIVRTSSNRRLLARTTVSRLKFLPSQFRIKAW